MASETLKKQILVITNIPRQCLRITPNDQGTLDVRVMVLRSKRSKLKRSSLPVAPQGVTMKLLRDATDNLRE